MPKSTITKYDGLKKIFNGLAKAGYYKHGVIINYDEILKNLYFMNLLIHKTYLIFKKDISDENKAELIAEFKDIDDNVIINKAVALFIVKKYSKKIITFYDTIYKLSNQTGGYDDEAIYTDNMIDNKLNQISELFTNKYNNIMGSPIGGKVAAKYTAARDILLSMHPLGVIHKIEKLLNIGDFLDIVDKLEGRIGFEKMAKDLSIPNIIIDAIKFGIINSTDIVNRWGDFIFNWTFFPIYQLENLPVIGIFYEIPLDIIGMIIDNSDLFLQPFMGLLPLGLDLMIKTGSTVPGIGNAIAAASIPLTLLEGPIEYFIENGADIVGLFLNVERKQWGLAYISALEVFPLLPALMDASTTNLYTVEKWTDKGVRFSAFMKDNIHAINTISAPFLINPLIMFQPQYVWDEIIYPNRGIIPIMKSIPIDKIKKVVGNVINF